MTSTPPTREHDKNNAETALSQDSSGTTAGESVIDFRDITWNVNAATILASVTGQVQDGQIVALLGPNGSGKSSLLRIVAGVRAPTSGFLDVADKDWLAASSRSKARTLAYVEQSATADRSLTVLDVVLLGRLPHRSLFSGQHDDDAHIAYECLQRVGMHSVAQREFGTLSGGEQQRVLIAKALAQHTDILVVDEPTNHLDIAAQLSILGLLRELTHKGTTILTALHDLNLAASFCDSVIVMSTGRIVACGPPNTVLTEELIRTVYGVDSTIISHPRTGKPLIIF
ncbi:ABC transporter ATP-binding protein [Timonella sp. A28]|uniref:ABC transporter ATP-binding protein n=1 Tax=Timonella sp. A28 TaxID=3442640 RepID=UPI003EBBCA1F